MRVLLVALAILAPSISYAGGVCSGVKGGCGRSYTPAVPRYDPPAPSTTHVKGYYRKDGTYVRPHERHTGGSHEHTVGESFPSIPDEPIKQPRTAARTTARVTAWNGQASDDHRAAEIEASSTAESSYRTWTDKSGKFTVIAEFKGMVNQTVTLRKTDGSPLKVAFDTLSKSDQDWIQDRRNDH